MCFAFSFIGILIQNKFNDQAIKHYLQWEEFTVAELSSFLKVLEREEKNHEMQIRERYQLLNERLRETMQLSNPAACKEILSNPTNHLAVSN